MENQLIQLNEQGYNILVNNQSHETHDDTMPEGWHCYSITDDLHSYGWDKPSEAVNDIFNTIQRLIKRNQI